MSSKNRIDEETAKSLVKECFTIADFCRKVGWVPRGDNYKTFHKYVKEYNLDISHFTGKRTNLNNRLQKFRELSVKDYINNNTIVRGSTLIKKLVNEGIKEYRCECCGNAEWIGNEIPLELHHINGNNTDNRVENLKLLCPNCHALTDNYRGKKNKKQHFTCSKCGREITKYSKSGLCNACVNQKNGKIKSLTKDEIIKLFKKHKSFCGVARELKCTDNTVRKWCKKYNLPIRTKELIEYIQKTS